MDETNKNHDTERQVTASLLHPAQGLPDRTVLLLPITSLRPHPENDVMFPRAPEARNKALLESIRKDGVLNTLVVTGDGCASPPGAVLGGNRRREAAMHLGHEFLRCEIRNNLTDVQEQRLMVLLNQVDDATTRVYSDLDRFCMEQALRETYVQGGQGTGGDPSRQGQRTDLHPELVKGRTDDLVAQELKQPINAVRERRKVFGSPLATSELRSALSDKKLSRTHAAQIVRQVEASHPAALAGDQAAVAEAAEVVNALVSAALTKASSPTRGQGQKRNKNRSSHTAGALPSIGAIEQVAAADSPKLTREQLRLIVQQQPLEVIAELSLLAHALPHFTARPTSWVSAELAQWQLSIGAELVGGLNGVRLLVEDAARHGISVGGQLRNALQAAEAAESGALHSPPDTSP